MLCCGEDFGDIEVKRVDFVVVGSERFLAGGPVGGFAVGEGELEEHVASECVAGFEVMV